ARRPGPPAQIDITVQDPGDGLKSVVVTKHVNATVSVPAFTLGTTNPVVITATKTNQSLGSQVGLSVSDVGNHVTRCTASGVIPFQETPIPTEIGTTGRARRLNEPSGRCGR